jgi:Inner membrane protein YgaP-like, transmembrane domain
MKSNMGKADRAIRTAVGVLALAVGLIYGSWWGLVGLIPLTTAMIGYCPLYAPFGFSTRKPEKRKTDEEQYQKVA